MLLDLVLSKIYARERSVDGGGKVEKGENREIKEMEKSFRDCELRAEKFLNSLQRCWTAMSREPAD